MISQRRRRRQSGSALLIVLVMAAMVAILLYREMPVATFEAQRQKEELLMDRGNEYKRAVKLYVRKFQTFPPSIDALENTNRMRFLRNRYVDPFTGKDDWRLLHAGPGGMITDSKIKQAAGAGGLAGGSGSSAGGSQLGAGSSVTHPFANSFDGSNPQGSGASQPSFPTRAPVMSNTGMASNNGGGNDIMAGMPQDPQLQQQGVSPNQSVPYVGYPGPPTDGSPNPTNSSGISNAGQYAGGNPMSSASGPPFGPGRFRGGNPTGNSFPPGGQGAGDGSMPVTPAPVDPQSTMQALLNNSTNPQQQSSAQSAFNNGSAASASGSSFGATSPTQGGAPAMGAMSGNVGGGIAGVASKSTGHTIKVLNDQTERSLWEFVYDMQKEAQANAPGLGGASNGANGTPGLGGNGTNGTTSNNGAANNGAVGQSSTFPSSFNSPSPTAAPNQ